MRLFTLQDAQQAVGVGALRERAADEFQGGGRQVAAEVAGAAGHQGHGFGGLRDREKGVNPAGHGGR